MYIVCCDPRTLSLMAWSMPGLHSLRHFVEFVSGGLPFATHLATHDEERRAENKRSAQPQITSRRIAEEQPAGEHVQRQLQIVERLHIGGIGAGIGKGQQI